MDARLLILGVLHRGDFHPYEIKRRLQAAMVECYIDVDVGTLYYAVRQLAKNDLIEAVAEVTDSEAEQVSVVAHLVNSGRVRLTGNFRGSQLR